MVHSLAAAMVAVSTFAVTPSKVEWQADYGKALAATRREQRPLLIVLDIPSNPQASLDSSLLTPEGDQAKMLEAYELCHVDVSTPYGQKVAQAFGATQFPHTSITDRTGAVLIFKKPGQIAPEEWSATLAKYQAGQRQAPRSTYYRGGAIMPTSYAPMNGGSNCPACQRAAMGM